MRMQQIQAVAVAEESARIKELQAQQSAFNEARAFQQARVQGIEAVARAQAEADQQAMQRQIAARQFAQDYQGANAVASFPQTFGRSVPVEQTLQASPNGAATQP